MGNETSVKWYQEEWSQVHLWIHNHLYVRVEFYPSNFILIQIVKLWSRQSPGSHQMSSLTEDVSKAQLELIRQYSSFELSANERCLSNSQELLLVWSCSLLRDIGPSLAPMNQKPICPLNLAGAFIFNLSLTVKNSKLIS